MSPQENWVAAHLHPDALRDMSRQEMKRLRDRLREERRAIQTETITGGPTGELCRRMNELETLEKAIERSLHLAPARGGMLGVFTSFRRAPQRP
ncbi:MAG: hypothetical protein KDC33_12015 [Thermoleophilia bacterium]|nr:hypothetical protein [Thermoleophilia bacterium]